MRKCPRENCGGSLIWGLDDWGYWEEKCLLCGRVAPEYLLEFENGIRRREDNVETQRKE